MIVPIGQVVAQSAWSITYSYVGSSTYTASVIEISVFPF